jgi:hypothetical protein
LLLFIRVLSIEQEITEEREKKNSFTLVTPEWMVDSLDAHGSTQFNRHFLMEWGVREIRRPKSEILTWHSQNQMAEE